MAIVDAVIKIGKVLAGCKDQFSRNGKILLEVRDVQALYDDWRTLDTELRRIVEKQRREREEND